MIPVKFKKDILYFRRPCTMACDGKCTKAWGMSSRPKKYLGKDPFEKGISNPECCNRLDDFVYLPDDELGLAPKDPGSYEGGHGKPYSPEYPKDTTDPDELDSEEFDSPYGPIVPMTRARPR